MEDKKTRLIKSEAHYRTVDKDVLHKVIDECQFGDYIKIETVQEGAVSCFQYVISIKQKI